MERKPEQILILDPNKEIHFKGPFDEVVTAYLKLTNPSARRVCFRVMTTAANQYRVRPNNGFIEPFLSTTIAFMLKPNLDNLNNKIKHKFMIQAIFAPKGNVDQELLWKEVSPEKIMESKLKCVFDLPVDFNSNSNSNFNEIIAQPVSVTTAPTPNLLSQSTNNEQPDNVLIKSAQDNLWNYKIVSADMVRSVIDEVLTVIREEIKINTNLYNMCEGVVEKLNLEFGKNWNCIAQHANYGSSYSYYELGYY